MATRFAAVIIALILVVAGGLIVRRSSTVDEAEPVRNEAARVTSSGETRPSSGGNDNAGHQQDAGGSERRRQAHGSIGSSEHKSDDAAAPDVRRESSEAMVIGSRSRPGVGAANSADEARRRDEVLRNMPAAQHHSDDAENPDSAAPLPDGLPRGTRFAAALNGNTATVDNHEPLVEKNIEHDGNDGIYFSPEAQLAYANRAGVQANAGTVALWVEPVDWDGQDGSVHSFFRLNDPSDTSYRFHLLKDSANLRFQFVTDQGEANVRVPIDWWPQGEGHYVAATWDNNVLRLYVDGAQMGEQPYKGTLAVPPSVPGWWGSSLSNGTAGAGAVLKDTLVTDRSLDQAEIQHLWEGQ